LTTPHFHDLELTYTSNAIEGNTLDAAETVLVIEQGITIGGKPLKDHIEAIDHHEAIAYVRDLARKTTRSPKRMSARCTAWW
jgi:Fic family protein